MFLSEEGHGFEVDLWALGVILYYMLYGEYPFESHQDDVEEIYRQIQEEEPCFDEKAVSPAANDLIRYFPR